MSDTLAIFNRTHIMTDIETMSTHQNGVIVSIGACSFTFENGIEHEFMVNIDIQSSVAKGLHIEKSTVEWWKTQPKETREAFLVGTKQIEFALNAYNDFVGTDKKQYLWAQGATFDYGLIRSSFEACDIPRNWAHYQEMDSRTVFNMLGIRNDKIRATQTGHHTALADAISQTQTLISALT